MKKPSKSPGFYTHSQKEQKPLPRELRDLVTSFLEDDKEFENMFDKIVEDEITAVEAPKSLRRANARGEKKPRSGEYVRAEFAKALTNTKGGK